MIRLGTYMHEAFQFEPDLVRMRFAEAYPSTGLTRTALFIHATAVLLLSYNILKIYPFDIIAVYGRSMGLCTIKIPVREKSYFYAFFFENDRKRELWRSRLLYLDLTWCKTYS